MPVDKDPSLETLTMQAMHDLAPHFGLSLPVTLPTIVVFGKQSLLYRNNPHMRDFTGSSQNDSILYNRDNINTRQREMNKIDNTYPSFWRYRVVGEETGHYLHFMANLKLRDDEYPENSKEQRAAMNFCEMIGGLASAIWIDEKFFDVTPLSSNLATMTLYSEDSAHMWGYTAARRLFEQGIPVPLKKLARCGSWKQAENLHRRYTGIRAKF